MPSRTVQAAAARTVPAPSTARREREPRRAPPVAPGEGRSAATAARVYLRTYLPYSYGRGGADRIRGASPPLVRGVAGGAAARPGGRGASTSAGLVSVLAQAAATGDRDVLIVAAVNDGGRRYEVRLTVHHGAARWVVTEISG
jgi:hypothetical protein